MPLVHLDQYTQTNSRRDRRRVAIAPMIFMEQENWTVTSGVGPVLATAVHAGHAVRAELASYIAIDHANQRREEDPITGLLAVAGDSSFLCGKSRFEVDLNRPRGQAFSTDPEDTWGLRVWRQSPPRDMIERSLQQHDRFYQGMASWLEDLIKLNGKLLVLDIHSFNHRRNGPNGQAAPAEKNPDIDLGATTMDHQKFGPVLQALQNTLRQHRPSQRDLDVRVNIRYPDGGHWPEWVFQNYGDDICTITLEYKKTFMNEWTGELSLAKVDALKSGLSAAKKAAVRELRRC